jgi:hypothetical protein
MEAASVGDARVDHLALAPLALDRMIGNTNNVSFIATPCRDSVTFLLFFQQTLSHVSSVPIIQHDSPPSAARSRDDDWKH